MLAAKFLEQIYGRQNSNKAYPLSNREYLRQKEHCKQSRKKRLDRTVRARSDTHDLSMDEAADAAFEAGGFASVAYPTSEEYAELCWHARVSVVLGMGV